MDDRAFWRSYLGNLGPGLRDIAMEKGKTELKENTVWKKNGLRDNCPSDRLGLCSFSIIHIKAESPLHQVGAAKGLSSPFFRDLCYPGGRFYILKREANAFGKFISPKVQVSWVCPL